MQPVLSLLFLLSLWTEMHTCSLLVAALVRVAVRTRDVRAPFAARPSRRLYTNESVHVQQVLLFPLVGLWMGTTDGGIMESLNIGGWWSHSPIEGFCPCVHLRNNQNPVKQKQTTSLIQNITLTGRLWYARQRNGACLFTISSANGRENSSISFSSIFPSGRSIKLNRKVSSNSSCVFSRNGFGRVIPVASLSALSKIPKRLFIRGCWMLITMPVGYWQVRGSGHRNIEPLGCSILPLQCGPTRQLRRPSTARPGCSHPRV